MMFELEVKRTLVVENIEFSFSGRLLNLESYKCYWLNATTVNGEVQMEKVPLSAIELDSMFRMIEDKICDEAYAQMPDGDDKDKSEI